MKEFVNYYRIFYQEKTDQMIKIQDSNNPNAKDSVATSIKDSSHLLNKSGSNNM